MKATTQKLSSFFALLSLFASLTGFAQTTAFTYQGKLDVNGTPANGFYDFSFGLLDNPTNGIPNPTAITPTNLNVLVSNGLFTTTLDFGAQSFTGSTQWLQINVGTNGSGVFTPLSPPQLLTSVPYAIRSLSASNLLGVLPAGQLSGTLLATNFANGTITSNLLADNSVGATQLATNLGVWTRAGTNIFYSAGNVGVGTATPQAKLQTTGAVIGGGPGNSIAAGVGASTIAGGGIAGFPNIIKSESSFIGAGNANLIDTNLNNSFIGAGYANTVRSVASFIGGGNINSISTNATYGFIGDGTGNSIQSGATSSFVGSGDANSIQVNAYDSAIVGGNASIIQSNSFNSFIGGGLENNIQSNAPYSVLAGGFANTILTSAQMASIGGGYLNTNGGFSATVPGGMLNAATGDYSFAAGVRAKAMHSGTFVWADGEGVDFVSTGANQFLIRASGGVGIGTTSPQAALDVTGAVLARGGAPGPSGSANNGFMFSSPGDNDSGMSSSSNGQIEFYSNSLEVMRIAQGGAVGIGTNNPQSKLHVNGDIIADGKVRMGTTGANYAIDSTESLRIVRGTINSAGAIVKGSGFTVTHPGTGTYVITFTTAFADVPTVTATAVNAIVRAGAVISASSVNVGTAAFNGSSADDSFHFIAIGSQ